MSVDTAIARFRRRQADLFRDTATVSRPVTGGAGTINTSSNVWTPTAAAVTYTGPCLIRGFTWEGTSIETGDQQVRLRGVRAKFPVDADIEKDDLIVPTASTYDASMVGVSFRVTDVPRDGWQISRWTIAEEVTE